MTQGFHKGHWLFPNCLARHTTNFSSESIHLEQLPATRMSVCSLSKHDKKGNHNFLSFSQGGKTSFKWPCTIITRVRYISVTIPATCWTDPRARLSPGDPPHSWVWDSASPMQMGALVHSYCYTNDDLQITFSQVRSSGTPISKGLQMWCLVGGQSHCSDCNLLLILWMRKAISTQEMVARQLWSLFNRYIITTTSLLRPFFLWPP